MAEKTELMSNKPDTHIASGGKKKTKAEIYLQYETQAAILIDDMTNSQLGSINDIKSTVHNDMQSILIEGESETHAILAANLVTLNALSNTMLSKACRATSPEVIQTCANIGLRAQDQVRKTILALHQVRNPKQNMYIAQQNVANIQQINHDTRTKAENELISEATHATLEQRRTSNAVSNNPQVKAMAELYRPNDD